LLLRPSPRTPNVPTGVPVEVAVTSLNDESGLRAALRGVDAVYHLAGGENQGAKTDLDLIDIKGTRTLAMAAANARIKRMFYISHLGADRSSGFPVLKAKGIAEEHIRNSGVPYTILRSSVLFGENDGFTTGLSLLLHTSPGFLPLPGNGKTLLQPLWIEDLVTCMIWALDDPDTINKVMDVGGSEYFSLEQVVTIIMDVIKKRRLLVHWPNPYMRAFTVIAENFIPGFPSSVFWLDYLAINRTCGVDSVPRQFSLMPARFTSKLEYLDGVNWNRKLFNRIFNRRA
jgi:NADH dehydrogenase